MAFEKYKVVPMTLAHTIPVWGISERRFLFFYKPLIFKKVILEPCALPEEVVSNVSHERLTFDSEERAEDEIDRLMFGEAKITEQLYLNGKIIRTGYSSLA